MRKCPRSELRWEVLANMANVEIRPWAGILRYVLSELLAWIGGCLRLIE